MLQPLLADRLAGLPSIAHGIFTRRGGVSQGIYASLNCGPGSGDDAGAVQENRTRVATHLGADDLLSAHQVHGTTALAVDGPWPAGGPRPKADALVTATRGLALGVLTADCAPILLAEPRAGVVAAVHAGWRGALAGIVEFLPRCHGGLRSPAPSHPRRCRPLHRPCGLRGRTRVRGRVLHARCRQCWILRARQCCRGSTALRSVRLRRRPAAARGHRRGPGARGLHFRLAGRLLLLPQVPKSAERPTTAGRSLPSY